MASVTDHLNISASFSYHGPLHRLERGGGGGVREIYQGYEIYQGPTYLYQGYEYHLLACEKRVSSQGAAKKKYIIPSKDL